MPKDIYIYVFICFIASTIVIRIRSNCTSVFVLKPDQYEFKYDAKRSQVNSLAKVSNIARQDFFVHCNNTVVYYDANTQTYDQAVHLRAFDEKVLTPGGSRRKKGTLQYDVDEQEDKCTVSWNDIFTNKTVELFPSIIPVSTCFQLLRV